MLITKDLNSKKKAISLYKELFCNNCLERTKIKGHEKTYHVEKCIETNKLEFLKSGDIYIKEE